MELRSWGLIAGIAASGVLAGGSFDRVGAVTLYDGTLGGTPNSGSYLNFFSIPTLPAPTFNGSNGVTLNTSFNEGIYAGYSNYNASVVSNNVSIGGLVNPLFPVLDSAAGYTLSFKMQINSQTNNGPNGPNRAGFSALILDNNKKGIEIGFRNSDIFAQPDASFNSILPSEQKTGLGGVNGILANPTTYDLTVLGNNYTLSTGGNTLISGLLRDYTSAQGAYAPIYNTANFLFLGDDTISAGASVNIQNITLNTNAAAVPEPSSLLGMGLAIGFGATLKRKLRQTNRSITKE
jgi:PEP-CTERM motif